MPFDSNARIPTRPLDYTNFVDLREAKELVVDYENHVIYISDANRELFPISGGGNGADGANGITAGGYGFVVCNTDGNDAAKTVEAENYELVSGTGVIVKFANNNTAENPTLNINNTGAIPIYYNGAPIKSEYITSDRFLQLMYDGTNYQVVGDILVAAKDIVPEASETEAGLMTPAQRQELIDLRNELNSVLEKLNNILDSSKITDENSPYDSALSDTSANAVKNKVVKAAMDTKMDKAGGEFTGEVRASVAATASYERYQLRNIALSTTASTPTGNGSILGVYS